MKKREKLVLGMGLCMCFFVIMATIPSVATCSPIELKAITFLPRGHKTSQPAELFFAKMNEVAKGELVIKYIGGPEVISGRDQPEALRSGAVDIVFCPINWTASAFNFKEAEALRNGGYSPIEERKRGVYDFLLDLHKNHGLYYLGRFDWREEFYMWSIFPVEKPSDLKGHKMYVPTGFFGLYDALGLRGVNFPVPEMYTAMERGTIEGTTLPLPPLRSHGVHGLVKYCVDHPMYSAILVCVANLDKWNKLPKNLQEMVSRTYAKWEAEEMMPLYEKLYDTERKVFQDSGIKFIKFSEKDAKWFNNIVEEVYWEDSGKRLGDKEYVNKIRKIMGK